MEESLFLRAYELDSRNLPFALVTVIGRDGTTPRKSGRMLVEEDGATHSTIGGHHVETEAVKASTEAMREGRGRIISVDSGHGRMELMIDVVNRVKRAYVIGYGHVGKKIAETLHSVDFALYIYDICPVDCQFAAEIHTGSDWKGILSGLVLDEYSALVVTVHAKDDILSLVDASKAFYIGAMSSRSRIIPGIMQAYSRTSGMSLSEKARRLVIVRGAGDLATGTIIKLWRAGYDVLALEIDNPTQIRRSVSFAEAVYDGEMTVDGVKAVRIERAEDAFHAFDDGFVPVLIDPDGKAIEKLHPAVVVDAIIAKKNLGTKIDSAPLVIALGPGFTAGVDADAVIETQRGHRLGRIIREGSAAPNTGRPGNIGGYTTERVIRSPKEGVFRGIRTFGDIVSAGETIAYVGDTPITATIDGMIRGMLHEGLYVTEGFKVADIDPRGKDADYTTPSDKAYAIAGGVLECVDAFFSGRNHI